jgi:hypothetical protein
MNQLESDPVWLAKLARLNAVIAEMKEPLAGNLFYSHFQADFAVSPPNPDGRAKRNRFRQAVAGRKRLLEVGVNGGHSAFLALTSNPEIEFHGVDVCEHAYVRPAVEWLEAEFPGRVFFYEGDCRDVLPRLARGGGKYDVFHIDGAKWTYFEDIRNCQMMRSGDAELIVDDIQNPLVAKTMQRCMREGRVRPLSGFPPMPPSIWSKNDVVALTPPTRAQSLAFRVLSTARRLRRSPLAMRTKALVRVPHKVE